MNESDTTILEKPASVVLIEPLATISNVSFLIAAILIALQGTGISTALIAALSLLAVGSAAFHASGSRTQQLPHIADVGSLYVVAGVVVFHAWGAELWILIAAMLVVSLLTMTIGRIPAALPIGVATLLIIAGIVVNAGWRSALLPLGLALVGFVVQILSERFEKQGKTRLDDIFHGAWHVLIAASVYTAWLASSAN